MSGDHPSPDPYLTTGEVSVLSAAQVRELGNEGTGMDLLRLYQNFGERLSFMGGIDVRVLYENDREKIDAELAAKIPFVKDGFGYVLHSDHSIPYNVHPDTYRYFIQKGLELGRYPGH